MKSYLESSFFETINPSKTNIIVNYIYRHSTMDINELNCYYYNPFSKKLAKEQKVPFFLATLMMIY